MSFGVAALLYLVTEELLVEAHEVDSTAKASLGLQGVHQHISKRLRQAFPGIFKLVKRRRQ